MAVAGQKMDEVQSALGSVKVHRCGPCETDAEYVDPHGYCVECLDYLCKDCFRTHRRNKASKHHKLLTNDELSTSGVAQPPSNACSEKCNKHTNEIIKFFCSEHSIVGCHVCIALGHRTCHLEYIPEKSKEFSDSVEYKETARSIEKELEGITKTMEKANAIESITETIHEQCLRDIDSFHTRMIDQLNKLRIQIKVQADNKRKKIKEDIESVKSTIYNLTTTLKQVEADIQRSKAAKQESQLFVATKRAQAVLQSHKMKAGEISLTAAEMMYQFVRDPNLDEVFAKSDNFGNLQNMECIESVEPVSNCVVLNIPEDATSDDVKMYFENKGLSHGGEIRNLDVSSGDGNSIIVFKEPKVVPGVCQKKDHSLSGHHVEIMPCAEYLGMSQWLFALNPVPDFIHEKDSGLAQWARQVFDKELSKVHAEVLWNQAPIQVRCTMKKEDICRRNLLRSWKDETNELIQWFTENLLVKTITVTGANWDDAMVAICNLTVTEPDTIRIYVSRDKYEVNVVGYGYKQSDLTSIVDTLKDFVQGHETET